MSTCANRSQHDLGKDLIWVLLYEEVKQITFYSEALEIKTKDNVQF